VPERPFHLALPIRDLASARAFYAEVLGCPVGRESERWIDFDFYGHQLSLHLTPADAQAIATNPVDGDDVPVRHFGVVLAWNEWEALGKRLARAGVPFRISPHVRFRGEVGEQGTFFVQDPSGNDLEFKSFRDPARLFCAH
jgi:hypothetical protein